jgi:ABC-type multidrug transport system fused ATPase/permease subunit
VLQAGLTLLLAALLLARLQPLALPLLLVAASPYGLVQASAATQFYTLSMGQTPATREARYLSYLLSTDTAAKEIRVFGLAGYLLGRYREILRTHERELVHLARRRGWRSGLAALLPAAIYAAILAYLALQALHRRITIGDLTLYIGLVWRSQDALQQMMFSVSGMMENGLFLDDFRTFLALPGSEKPASRDTHPTMLICHGICFDGVTYRYPRSERAALDDLSLELRTGEMIAIVGENGAGKTTLVKMLARLYQPDACRITVDGRDIRELDLQLWRRQIAVIFQDYLQYYLTVAENIGFGDITALQDELRVLAAAERSGAHDLIRGLPHGYHTRLGRWFEGGVRLSGGEWQRIALARALMRGAPILVLDEPTASLDARAELEIFQHLRDLTRDRIVLLISHRFSTVRMADRIYVLDSGRVLEAGSHDDLRCRGGRYSELFHLQAAGYR